MKNRVKTPADIYFIPNATEEQMVHLISQSNLWKNTTKKSVD